MFKKKLAVIGGLVSAFAFSPIVLADDDDDDEIPFDVAEVFFELNDTDGDLGIHALIDGDPWKRLTIEDKREKKILNIFVRGKLRRQGLTEIFFESAEPTFDALPPEKFFKRFPAGTYEVEGRTIDGEERENEVDVTHAMPAPPVPEVNGTAMAEQCDEDEAGYDAVEVAAAGETVEISWEDVISTHPDLGSPQGEEGVIEVINYQVVVETELEIDGEEFTTVFSAIIPPDVTSMTVPAEFIGQSDEFKYEVLAREESWNQTAVESCFLIGD